MSSTYMRQIIESIDRANAPIVEGYQDRVNQMVDFINKNNSEGITRRQFSGAFKHAGQTLNPVEMKSSPQARRDFEKDVMAQIKFRRDTSSTDDKREKVRRALDQLGTIISDAVGNSFPDGDPFDSIYPKARRLGIPADNMIEWLDRAVKKAGMGESYHDYLADVWDDHIGDYNDMQGGAAHHTQNPWR